MRTQLFIALGVSTTYASASLTKATVNCRTEPNTSSRSIKTIPQGSDVTVACHIYGERVHGNAIWDLISDGCYVPDYHVKTSSSASGSVSPPCNRIEPIKRKTLAVDEDLKKRQTTSYPVKEDLRCRGGASTAEDLVITIPKGKYVDIYCQKPNGQNIKGTTIWDFVNYGEEYCWVSDYYVKTGSSGMVTKRCMDLD